MSSGSNKVWCLTNLFSAFHYHHLIPRPVPCWHFSPWSLHPSRVLPIWWEARAAGGLGGLAGVCSWLVELRYHWPMVGGCTEVLFAPRGHWISVYCSVSWNLGIEQEFNFLETLSLLPNLVEIGQQMQNYLDDHTNLASLRNKARKILGFGCGFFILWEYTVNNLKVL